MFFWGERGITMKTRVMIRFKNQCAVSFKCEKNNADAVVEIILKELKKTMDDVSEIKFTDVEE